MIQDRRLGYALAGIVLLIVLVGSYAALAGDDHEPAQPPAMDGADDAATVAQAVRHLHTEDYSLTSRLYWTNATTGELELRTQVTGTVQNSERQALFTYDDRERYANRAVEWQRWDHTDWRKQRTTGWDGAAVNPLGDPDRIERVDVERVGTGESDATVVFRVSDTADVEVVHSSFEAYEDATLEVSLDRERGYLVGATLVESPEDGDGTVHHELRFEDHGEATVDRPDDLGFDFEEWLLVRYYGVR